MPKFVLGNSLGGLISLKLGIERPEWFNGIGCLVPYIKLYSEDKLTKYLPIAKFLEFFVPGYRLAPFPGKHRTVPSNPIYGEYAKPDPLLEIHYIPVHNLIVNASATKHI